MWAPTRASRACAVITGVRWATPFRRAAAWRTSSMAIAGAADRVLRASNRRAGVAHQAPHRHPGEVMDLEPVGELAQHPYELTRTGDHDLDDLAGMELPHRIVGVMEPHRSGDQPASRAVGDQPLADARAARFVEK